jgi:SAM-dependent methyltransferase
MSVVKLLPMTVSDLDLLLREATGALFRGWDFSLLEGRLCTDPLPWDFRNMVQSRAEHARSMLDMGTGGGELLATIDPRPAVTVATEGHQPNWSVASERLFPLGVTVVAVGSCPDNNRWEGRGGLLPFRSAAFDLIVNRHEAYSPVEVERVLAPGGVFVTQQVGGRDEAELLDWFGRASPEGPEWDLELATRQLEESGLEVTAGGEAYPSRTFADVGALVYYLNAVPWRVPGFDVIGDRTHLEQLHEVVTETNGPLEATSHRFWLNARRGWCN